MIRCVALLLMLLASGAAAQDAMPPGVTAGDAAGIRTVITRQLEAFRRDDAAGAYAFAAPNIHEAFPTPEVFMSMVRRGYAPVYRPQSTEFSELAIRDGALVQEVELVGPDGKPVLALYTVVRDGQGGWKIAACVIIPSVRVGA